MHYMKQATTSQGLAERMLKPYACHPGHSRGRQFDEVISTFRSPFQRDRDRIIHASAFRRLKA